MNQSDPDPEAAAARAAAPPAPVIHVAGRCWMAALQKTDRAATRWAAPLLILCAVFYYAAYFSAGFNLAGEGGTTAMYAQRLLEGQRPLADTFLGYNVLWFWPVAWLFAVAGPDYLVMKGFFFALCVAAALLGAATVWRVSRSGLLAFATGLVLILIPGMLFRNYMGLLAVANQFALLGAFVLPARSATTRVLWIGMSGLVLGLTFLIRIEVGWFMAVIWGGLLVLFLCAPGTGIVRWRQAVAGALLACGLFAAAHAPAVADARQRDYLDAFLGQYTAIYGMIRWKLEEELRAVRTAAARGQPRETPTGGSKPVAAPVEAPSEVRETWRPRPAPHEMFTGKGQRERYFAAAVFLPVFFSGLLLAGGMLALLAAWWKRDPELWSDALGMLVLVGCALTLFPQYFFFRPDTPHLVEFMLPFIPALACAAAVLVRRAARAPSVARLVLAGCGVCAAAAMVWIHFGHAWPKESAGTIAARQKAEALFVAQNGVRVLVGRQRAAELEKLRDTIMRHSGPEDFVVCFPYSPTVNFMTARRSYLWNLHMDDSMSGQAHLERQARWLEENRPAVVVVDNRAVNQTERSRFRNWAASLYQHIREEYVFAGLFDGNEVFVLPEKLAPDAVETGG